MNGGQYGMLWANTNKHMCRVPKKKDQIFEICRFGLIVFGQIFSFECLGAVLSSGLFYWVALHSHFISAQFARQATANCPEMAVTCRFKKELF